MPAGDLSLGYKKSMICTLCAYQAWRSLLDLTARDRTSDGRICNCRTKPVVDPHLRGTLACLPRPSP